MTKEEIRNEIQRREDQRDGQMLLDLRRILETDNGFRFFTYLFRELEIGQVPDIGFQGPLLHDKLGFIRAGNSILALINRVSPDTAGRLFAQKAKELYALTVLDETIPDDGNQ